MIYDYEIKGDTLYLFFNFDNEFAKLKVQEKQNKLKDVVNNFIKENKIKFKGNHIKLLVGGILLGTLLLTGTYLSKQNNNIDIYPDYQYALVWDNNIKLTTIEETNKKNVEITKEESTISQDEINNTPEEKNVVIKNDKIYELPKKTIKEQPVIDNKTEIIKEIIEEEIIDNKTYITLKRRNGTLLNLELEDYIVGVVGAEMPASFNIEALKAQAVIARTYTLKTLERGNILTDSSSTQNYKSNDELKSMWTTNYEKYYSKIKNAVDSTTGMYLTYNGKIIDAVYHSTSNGTTEDASNVWSGAEPYLIPVESIYDNTNKTYQKDIFISYEELTNKLQIEVDNNMEFNILSRTSGNRVGIISINNKEYTGVLLRNILGLRSADFVIVKSENGVTITTYGYGHGVGLSQYGANGYANNGLNFEQILKHYYSGVNLSYKK